jgi:hypothetical protein
VEVYRRFRGVAASIIRVLMMEAASTSEMPENFYQTTWHNNPEDSHLHNCCQKNLKSHSEYVVLDGYYCHKWKFIKFLSR